MERGLNILSLCDGMSCGQITLKELGIKVDNYFASEIDKNAIKVTQENFPNTKQIGDVTLITHEMLDNMPKIDLVLFGSPCRSISRASQGNKNGGKDNNGGLEGISKLFINCVDILKYIKEMNNPNVLFLSENVTSKKHDEDITIMSKLIGVQPIVINSSLFSAQDRERNYWTNIPIEELPKENKTILKDIMDKNVDEKYYYTNQFQYFGEDKRMAAMLDMYGRTGNSFSQVRKVCSKYFKSYTLISCRGGNHQIKVYDNGRCRKLTPNEYRKLQTVPEWYKMNVADGHIYNMCGDGWTIETIKHIFKGLNTYINEVNIA